MQTWANIFIPAAGFFTAANGTENGDKSAGHPFYDQKRSPRAIPALLLLDPGYTQTIPVLLLLYSGYTQTIAVLLLLDPGYTQIIPIFLLLYPGYTQTIRVIGRRRSCRAMERYFPDILTGLCIPRF